MELEEAKKIILSYIDRYEYVNKSVRYDENGYKATLEKHIEAFNTVIGDLHALQNLVDEKNDELEHLQKEYEEFRKLEKDHNYSVKVIIENSKLRYELAHSVSCEKIREQIKEAEQLKERVEKRSVNLSESVTENLVNEMNYITNIRIYEIVKKYLESLLKEK